MNVISKGYRGTGFGRSVRAALAAATVSTDGHGLEVAGISVTPRVVADSLWYTHTAEPPTGARVDLFLRHGAGPGIDPLMIDARMRILFDGRSPREWLAANVWAWHSLPPATPEEQAVLPPGALTVWTINGRTVPFGPGGRIPVEAGPAEAPWLSREVAIG